MNNDADPFSTISTAPSSLAHMRDAARESRCVDLRTGANARANIRSADIAIEKTPIQIKPRGHRLAMAPFFIGAISTFFVAAPAATRVSFH